MWLRFPYRYDVHAELVDFAQLDAEKHEPSEDPLRGYVDSDDEKPAKKKSMFF